MPLPQEVKRWYIQSQLKLDPEKYDLDDNTYEPVEKEVAAIQPSLTPTPQAKSYTATGTAARNAALGVLPTAGGLLAGAGVGTMVGGPIGTIAGLAAGLAGGFGTAKAQEKVLESTDVGKEFLANTAQANVEHPVAATVGNIASALPTMRFNPKMLVDAGKAISAGQGVKALANPAVQQLAIGAGIGAGQGVYDEMALPSPEGFSIPRFALNVAGNALLSPRDIKPLRALGVQPYTSPESYNRPSILSETLNAAQAATAPATTIEQPFRPNPPIPRAKINSGDPLKQFERSDAMARYTTAEPRGAIETLEGEGGAIPRDVSEIESVQRELNRAELQAKQEATLRTKLEAQKLSEANAIKAEELKALEDEIKMRQVAVAKPKGVNPQREFTKGMAEVPPAENIEDLRLRQTEEALSGRERPRYQEEGQEPVTERPVSTAQIIDGEVVKGNYPNDFHYKIIQQEVKRRGIDPESDEGADLVSRLYYSENAGFITNKGRFVSREEAASLTGTKHIEPRYDSAFMDEKGNTRPGVFKRKPMYQREGQEPNAPLVKPSPELLEANKRLATRRGVDLEVADTPTVTSPTGKEVAGYVAGTRGAIGTTRADTGVHELAHVEYSRLPEKLRKRFNRGVENDAEAKAWMARNKGDSEEYLAQAAGDDDIRRILSKDDSVWRDLTAWWRASVSGKAKKEDIVRFLANRVLYSEPATKGMAGVSGIKTKEQSGGVDGLQADRARYTEIDNIISEMRKTKSAYDVLNDPTVQELMREQQVIKNRYGGNKPSDVKEQGEGQEGSNKAPQYVKLTYNAKTESGSKKVTVWAEKLSEGSYRKVNSEGDWGFGGKLTLIKTLPKDVLSELPAKIDNKYGTLTVIKSQPIEQESIFPRGIPPYVGHEVGEAREILRTEEFLEGKRDSARLYEQYEIKGKPAKHFNPEIEYDRTGLAKLSKASGATVSNEDLNRYNELRSKYYEQKTDSLEEAELDSLHNKIEEFRVRNEALSDQLIKEPYPASGETIPEVARQQRNQQESSPEFKKWFEGSKVVDAEGKPLVVYHGSSSEAPFSVFNKSGTKDMGYHGRGYYFSESPEVASNYARQWNKEGFQFGGIYPVYVALKNPADHKIIGKYSSSYDLYGKFITAEEAKRVTELLKKDGYDGVYVKEGSLSAPEIVAFYPEQIKSAIGNRGTFDPTDPDIRHQSLEQEPVEIDTSKKGFFSGLEASFDKVERVSKPLANAFRRWEARRDQYLGLRNVAIDKLRNESPEDIRNTFSYMRAKFRGEAPTTKPVESIRNALSEYFTKIREEQIDAGLRIEGREAGKNPDYVPDMLSDKTIDLFTRKAGTIDAKAAVNTWAKYVNKESNGKISVEEASKNIREYIDALGATRDNYRAINFGALRRAQGYGLPQNLREENPMIALNKYAKRASSDLALYKELESRPEIASILKLRDPNTGKIPEGGDTDIGANVEVRKAMKWVMNNFEGTYHPAVASFVRLVNNSLLGIGTGIRDIVAVPVNSLPYINRFSDLSAYARGMTNLRENAAASLKTHARQHQQDKLMWSELLQESPNAFLEGVNKLATGMRKWQGRELIEQASRIWTFGVGKDLARRNVILAKGGDAKAKTWLDNFGLLVDEDVTKLSGEKLNNALDTIAKNFTDRVQGTYGGRGLPTFTQEGALAPFTTLQKWGIEKSNVIYKDVIAPALSGENYVPLLSYTLGSVLTGAAIQELNRVLTNRKPQEANIKETLAKPNASNVVAEFITLAQLGSWGGIVSDGAKAAIDIGLRGKTPRNIISFPAATAVGDTAEQFADVSEALQQGEPVWDTLRDATLDFLVAHVQNARMIANHTLKREDIERSDKFRDYRVYRELSGEAVPDLREASPNKYLNKDAQTFKRATTVEEVREVLPRLAMKLQELGADDPAKARKFLRGLRANSYQTMPSPEGRPEEFAEYYNYLVKTLGEEGAEERVIDYLKQNEFNRSKTALLGSSEQ